MRIFNPLFLSAVVLSSCMKEKADLIIHNARIYCLDSACTVASALAVKNGLILRTGTDEQITGSYFADSVLNLDGLPVYPGFIDAHCHFMGYGLTLQWIDLKDTRSFNEVIGRLSESNNERLAGGGWILGRGWDQNDWPVRPSGSARGLKKKYPKKNILDSLFPSVPVFLKRIDGHAALVNSFALKTASITPGMKIDGGIFEIADGELTGILIDNAVDAVEKFIPSPTLDQKTKALLDAQTKCFEAGLTTVDDAGLDKENVQLIDSLQKSGQLKMRVYAMLNPTENNYLSWLKSPPYISGRLSVRSVKLYCDGALGSRGALLLEPYADMPDHYGLRITPPGELLVHARKIAGAGFQVNTHCIGDSAVRIMLGIYYEALRGDKERRWRIEHAQVVNPSDLMKFRELKIIPSVQPTHATSDMYWAGDRLGSDRIKSAYAYNDLLAAAGIIACGSDFPVEQINPLLGFYAAVVRKDTRGYPTGGFQPENALSRGNALKGMTIWAAYANFEEKVKGSIEPGKYADFTILDKDIMTISPEEITAVKVMQTFVNGECVYRQGK
ncbi:MAG: amidohydrolase [Bacteroidetes bacterium]|nr:amidohydrolase [Bacteroidota bacterium]